MATINFAVTSEEASLISRIVERAANQYGEDVDRLSLAMDITAAHANGCPLDLDGLLGAEPFDFAHDIGGIGRHIDRETGVVGGFFRPRYAV